MSASFVHRLKTLVRADAHGVLESLEERGLSLNDLLGLKYEDEDDDWAEKDSIRLVSRQELGEIMDQQDVVFSF